MYFILVYLSSRTIVVVFELELRISGWGSSVVDEGQFIKYFLSFGVCQRIKICNNMDRRMPELM